MSKKNENKSFEENLHRLEQIAALLESDDVSLEGSISLFEEGITLSRKCMNELKNAELKIVELKKKLNEEPAGLNNLVEE